MKIIINKKTYETVYFPFFRKQKTKLYTIFGLRFPSGHIDSVIVDNDNDMFEELNEHLTFILCTYGLENDDALTEKAIEVKKDVRKLFGLDT